MTFDPNTTISTVSTICASFKSIVELLKGFKNFKDTSAIQAATSELMSKVLETQQIAYEEQMIKQNLINNICTLKEKILNFENWEVEKTKYFLDSIGGAFVYSLRDEPINEGVEFHQICTNCYEEQRKSILQHEPRGAHDKIISAIYFLVCHNCHSRLPVNVPRKKMSFNHLKSMNYGV